MISGVERIYSEEQLKVLNKRCQKLFRLQDWHIEVSLCHQNTIVGKRGEIRYSTQRHHAHITLVTPESYEALSCEPQDMLRDLIHEYVHIVFAQCDDWFEKNSLEESIFELAIERVAIAITAIDNELLMEIEE